MKGSKGAGIPCHIAIIMDGNGRWAKKRLLPRSAGHRAGMNRLISLTEHIFSRGVKYCTLYALSTENLSRPKEELEGLYGLFRDYFGKNVEKLKAHDITLKVIGNLELLPEDVAETIRAGEQSTEGGEKGTLVLAIAYGGRQDILSAANRAVRQGKELSETEFSAMLSTGDIPDPDLLIRTGKEVRISNFLLYEAAYAELYFSDKLFPDFSDDDIDEAIAVYASRERRYGKI